MATFRPVVSVYEYDNPSKKAGTVQMPHVFVTPLRPDIVQTVHNRLWRNTMQAHGVKAKAGYQTAAESWGTGRAVARIPRAPGSGTHRAGQGAFGNMCRGGGMFAPLKTWRKWNKKTNLKERRHAVCSALAASVLPPLVMAHGHRIGEVPELPLVVSDGVESVTKTKEAVKILKSFGLTEDMQRVIKSKRLNPSHGKKRNRRYKQSKGPMVIYHQDNGIVRAFRNIPGVDLEDVQHLNLRKLAPGGQFGRMLVWTESAFRYMSKMYGTFKKKSPMKAGYRLPRAVLENADIGRIINSVEIQSVLNPKKEPAAKWDKKKNPLKNSRVMDKLNPFAAEKRRVATAKRTKGTPEFEAAQAAKKARVAEVKAHRAQHKTGENTYYKTLMRAFETKAAPAEAEAAEEEE